MSNFDFSTFLKSIAPPQTPSELIMEKEKEKGKL